MDKLIKLSTITFGIIWHANCFAGALDDICSASESKGVYEVECSNDFKASEVSVTNKSGLGVLRLENERKAVSFRR